MRNPQALIKMMDSLWWIIVVQELFINDSIIFLSENVLLDEKKH